MSKRIFDIVCASLGLLVLSPLILVVACWVKLDSPGPVFYRQERVGRYGRLFRIFKFRTMTAQAESGSEITVAGDARITNAGRALRRFKVDELPQLINVLVGQMSLVGPRPEVPRYVARYPAGVSAIVLSVRPGMTDWASIAFREENAILGRATDPERVYIEEILPVKLDYYVRYVSDRSFLSDLRVVLATLAAVVR